MVGPKFEIREIELMMLAALALFNLLESRPGSVGLCGSSFGLCFTLAGLGLVER